MSDFNSLGLTQSLLLTLEHLEFTTPTPIQQQAIPVVLEGRDIMGLAQTGTGKTGAFGLPVIDQLLREPNLAAPGHVRALILAPTRELASQIATSMRAFAKRSPLKIQLVVGGQSMNAQSQRIGKGADILIATPGRLLDHMKRNTIKLDSVRHLILDEADQMLDLGFIHDLRRIAKAVPQKRQTLMFSATMPAAINDLAKTFLTNPQRIETTPAGRAADKVTQVLYQVAKGDKPQRLRGILASLDKPHAMVFTRTKHGADKLQRDLGKYGYTAAAIHGNKSQGQRNRALQDFKDGRIRILVATDVAARGIDIPGVTHVFNYDLPEVPDVYVHRIGRTARAGADGAAIAFCSPEEGKLLRDIERLLKSKIERVTTHDGDGTAQAPEWFADNRAPEPVKPAGNGAANGKRKPTRRQNRGPNHGAKPAGEKSAQRPHGERSGNRRPRKPSERRAA